MNDPAATSQPRRPEQEPLRAIEIVALLAVLMPIVLRTVVSIDPFPYWSANPLESWVGLTGLSPANILICDCLTLMGSGALMWLLSRRGILMQAWQVAPALPAIAVAAWWGVRAGGSVDHLAVGMPWAAGLASAIAASSAMRIDQARRVLSGVLIGICAMLALKAIVQVGIEHPALVRDFKANRDAIFMANGWTPDSSMARAYERRVMQSEATGWFGLANPFATIGAAVTVFGLALLVPLSREKPRTALGVVTALIGVIIVALAGAKGGYVAAAVGVGVLGVAWALARPKLAGKPRLAGIAVLVAGLGAIALPLLLVAARGLAGDRLGELSIWFRAMYLQAAARIFAHHPWVGVGPAGFKDAYLLYKNPLNPEEVASPHSVIADFGAGLGIAGLFAGVLVIFFAIMAMSRASTVMQLAPAPHAAQPDDDDQEGVDRRLIAISLVTPVLIAAYLERDMATIENLVVRVLGLAIAVMLAVHVAGLSSRRVVLGLAAAALAALAHAQIEMTPILSGSSGWFWLLVGMGGAATLASAGACRLGKAWSIIGSLAVVLIGGVIAAAALPGVMRWNAALKEAAMEVRPLAQVKALLQQGAADSLATQEALAILTNAMGRPVTADPQSVKSAVDELLEKRTDTASRALMRARNEGAGHYGTARAYSQLIMFRAELALQRGDRVAAQELANLAVAAVESDSATNHAARWGWIGTLRVEQAKRGLDPRQALEQADQAFQQSRTRDPWGLNPLLRQIEVVKNMGQNSRAADLAKVALELDQWSRLDPLKGLTPAQKAELERLAATAKPQPSPPPQFGGR